MNKRYNSIIHGYTKSAPKRVKAKQAKQLARQTSLPLGGRSVRGTPQYAALSDGQSFVLVDSVGTETANPPQIHIVQNWYEAFRNRERD